MVGAFSRAGFCDPRALHVVADAWRDVHPEPETRWSENEKFTLATLERLPAEVVDDALNDEDIRRILETWKFPMYGADMRIVEEDLERLRGRQRNWDPDGRSLADHY